MTLSPDRLKELREIAEAATPTDGVTSFYFNEAEGRVQQDLLYHRTFHNKQIKELLDEIERLKNEIMSLQNEPRYTEDEWSDIWGNR